MHIAMLSPIAWRTPPENYGPWESVVSLLTEELLSRGYKVTLFATGNSKTSGKLHSVCARGYDEDNSIIPKVWECLHISELFEHAEDFDIIHNNFDYLPLTYTSFISTPVVTTIHGFSSPGILPVYKKYNNKVSYISISDADRSPELDYIKTIHHGIDLNQFDFQNDPDDYLLFFGRIHPDKGTKEAIEIARACNKKLILAGIIQDEAYYNQYIVPYLDSKNVVFIGSAGPAQRNQLLGKATALLHPINFEEPFGLSVIESMACGTPVIAFNRGSMPELIENGKNGFLVNTVDDAIGAVRQIKNIDRKYCRRYIEQYFTVNQMAEKYIQVYQKILNKMKNNEHPSWGSIKILANDDYYKITEFLIHPQKQMFLRNHRAQSAHLYIIQGQAQIKLNNEVFTLEQGESIALPEDDQQSITNLKSENMRFIEVQTGGYLKNNDTKYFSDEFLKA
ncbi:MAG: glycosyltransferase [Bacteroidetes bacterium]|nr:glycosyltransferase [Bacteroidota bacterium]